MWKRAEKGMRVKLNTLLQLGHRNDDFRSAPIKREIIYLRAALDGSGIFRLPILHYLGKLTGLIEGVTPLEIDTIYTNLSVT